mgnify:FL=1
MSNNKWYLYGHVYDLTNFLDKHPGGRTILEFTKNEGDITATFESYHSLADIKSIRKTLETYKISNRGKKQMYTFNEKDFYNTCRSRVKEYFGNTIWNLSVTHKIKANIWWLLKTTSIFGLYLISFYIAFFTNYEYDYIMAFISGILVISFSFCILHDASHCALIYKNGNLNNKISKIANSLILWNSNMWTYHHSFRHHTYTGIEILDLDNPYLENLYIINAKYIRDFFILFLLVIFPGSWGALFLKYWIFWRCDKSVPYKKIIGTTKLYEYLIIFLMILIHIKKGNILVSSLYFIACNLAFMTASIANHDTYETIRNINNSQKKITDWGETQVINSSNFQINKYYNIYHHLFGGINYQIEHHLFPSMCHIYYPEISHIIQKTCKEFNIPYIQHTNIFTSIYDYFKSYSTNIRTLSN